MRKRSGPSEATPCLVLRVVDYGDADRIVTLLTAAHGKISALAKGARSSRRRYGAALSSFGFGEAMLEERRGQDLWSLSDLHVTRGFPNLPLELSRFGHAAYACELCLHLCPPHVPEPEVLRLLVTLLDYLDGLPIAEKPSPLALRIFELRLLVAVGLALQLYDCAACGGPVPAAELVPLDVRRGGVLCDSCFLGPVPSQLGPQGGGLTSALRDLLAQLETRTLDPASFADLSVDPVSQRQVRELLQSVIQNHLGHGLKAVEFISKMNAFSFDS